jgi:hypothetical protein
LRAILDVGAPVDDAREGHGVAEVVDRRRYEEDDLSRK